ncbi:NADPH-dependent oxidoreductase [Prescottella agglutinans]|uniref:NADPH-dependent oxidoreductase n=1 Tax=Prescottella agglutinans TaxID=1644129 RepID=A0A3S3D127_9NOCA|nr:NAD(P)H-dependent oxidoreductase [Prescottella agglutinans]RVW10523.1 NADPH-dependent oxidoreductase [Prescottella agglutinans]
MDTNTATTSVPRIAVIVGSTRPHRRARLVADWVQENAEQHLLGRAKVEIVDLAEYDLPLLDEPVPAAIGTYAMPHTRRWAEQIATYDGFVFVTPEYNHSFPAALKNAVDFLFSEWNDKAAGFVSYGLHGGVRAAEHLRLTLAEVKIACVRSQVALSLFTDFDLPDIQQPGRLTPAPHHDEILARMLDEVADWSEALGALRSGRRP